MIQYRNRQEAGTVLAKQLNSYVNQEDGIVLALPRGGVPVAYEVAMALGLPLDIFIVRKLGVPWHAELAMGALASGGTVILNEVLIRQLQIEPSAIEKVLQEEQRELERREIRYRGNIPFPVLKNKTIILVDDGIATGYTMRAAVEALRQHEPAKIIVAVPVAPQESFQEMANLVDEIVCPLQPMHFYAVGQYYEDFAQTTDEEVIALFEVVAHAEHH